MATVQAVFCEEVQVITQRIERFHKTGGVESGKAALNIVEIKNGLVSCNSLNFVTIDLVELIDTLFSIMYNVKL